MAKSDWRRSKRNPRYCIEHRDFNHRISRAVINGQCRYSLWQKLGNSWVAIGLFDSSAQAVEYRDKHEN